MAQSNRKPRKKLMPQPIAPGMGTPQRMGSARFSRNDFRTACNSHITSLCSQLGANITAVSSAITKTTNLQRIHNTTKNQRLASFWSFPITELERIEDGEGSRYSTNGASATSGFLTSDESRQQRIARLRAEAWTTVGLRAKERGWKGVEHYERICTQALAELYGDE